MRLADIDYELPPDRIAQTPIEPRDAARLLVDRGDAPPEHRHVADLPDLLEPGDVVVVNDTAVFPARLRLQRPGGGGAEVLLLEPIEGPSRWEALARPGRRLRAGDVLVDRTGVPAVRILGRRDDLFDVEIVTDGPPTDAAVSRVLDRAGEMPLPPYITTPLERPDRYQTVYAGDRGSAAAPTAGLHLTPAVLDRFAARGIDLHRVQLFVGLDTFQPVTVDDPLHHPIHTERYRVPEETWAACVAARAEGRAVVAVGTTAVRALESAAFSNSLAGRTSLYIHRGHRWQVVDRMMTNFHLPRTTLLMMIDSFVGARWRDLYRTAIDEGYRFLSFGDAMLLDRRLGRSDDGTMS